MVWRVGKIMILGIQRPFGPSNPWSLFQSCSSPSPLIYSRLSQTFSLHIPQHQRGDSIAQSHTSSCTATQLISYSPTPRMQPTPANQLHAAASPTLLWKLLIALPTPWAPNHFGQFRAARSHLIRMPNLNSELTDTDSVRKTEMHDLRGVPRFNGYLLLQKNSFCIYMSVQPSPCCKDKAWQDPIKSC